MLFRSYLPNRCGGAKRAAIKIKNLHRVYVCRVSNLVILVSPMRWKWSRFYVRVIFMTLFCRLLIITGVILLVGSTRLLRFITSQQKRSNMEKNYGPRRSTTSRVREPSPSSAVIQASTLNHLLSSSSKEKAWLDTI